MGSSPSTYITPRSQFNRTPFYSTCQLLNKYIIKGDVFKMESEVKCPDERVNRLQFDQIKQTQDKIVENQNEHNTRLRILEENKIQMTSEFANLKQSQADHKVLMLDLDRISREKSDKMFDKVLVAQIKNEENSEKKFDSQNAILLKIVEGQNITQNGKLEMSKGKMVMYGGIFVALITALPYIIEAFTK